jgi:deoxyguanosine kinase
VTHPYSDSPLPQHIVVEGPIGVGKTSLVKQIAASLGYQTLLEDAVSNPFLDQFYRDPASAALQTQLYFLKQRVDQLKDLQAHPKALVADFLLEKDPLFAEVTLTKDELALYKSLYNALTPNIPKPDLVVYLQAQPKVLLERIHKRGIKSEGLITAEYLQALNEAYSHLFHYYDKAPVLIVNASDIDWVNSPSDYQHLLKYLLSIGKGRHYYNPLSR